jgi:PII-like signaling protein
LETEYSRLKIYLEEDDQYHNHSMYHEVILRLRALGCPGATVTRGIAGYGKDKELHTNRIITLTLNLPIIIEVIDTTEHLESISREIKEMTGDRLITMEKIRVL